MIIDLQASLDAKPVENSAWTVRFRFGTKDSKIFIELLWRDKIEPTHIFVVDKKELSEIISFMETGAISA